MFSRNVVQLELTLLCEIEDILLEVDPRIVIDMLRKNISGTTNPEILKYRNFSNTLPESGANLAYALS